YIWICTSEGAWCFNRNTGALEMNLFEGEKISNLMIDREGNFWFTSLENGIYVVPEIAMKIFNEENAALIDQNISSVYLMNDSLLAVGAFDGSAFILNTLTDEIEFLPRQDGLRYRTASAILLKGNELIISRNFISVINLQQKTEKTFTYTYLRDIAFDGNTLFFASSDGAGFFNFQEMKESGKMNYKIISDESSKLVECDTVRHVVWFVQSNGLAQYNGDSLIYQEVKGNRIYPSALFFHNNVLWAGTSGEGIYGFENNELKYHLESGNVLSGNSISALYVNDSILACASEKGVNLIYYKTQRKFLLDLTDGINTRDINSLSINKDYIFIGCTRGLYAYPLSKLRRNTIPLELTIEAVYVGNEFQKDKSIIKINDGEDLRIFFRSASFRSRGNFEFRYMMTNQPGGWNYLDGKSREIYFNNLASGEYDLLLDAVNEDGVSCQNPLRIHLVVRPPFWQRWWFYALIALISLTVAAVFYNIRIKSIRRKALLKEKVIRYQLRAIKAQMNPHFIFNSLTSIQDLILQQDYQNSYSYLTKFSGILRMVLDFSESDEVSLADEIRFLNTYLILEKLRFGNEFSYSIVLKSDSDSQYIHIPPLLIQPFVENAIKHGLLHKKGDKKLEVNFEVIDTANKKRKIICTITDNGVGRKRASEINLKREPNHHSFATKATEQRLDLLNSREDYQVEFAIHDLVENHEPAGTKVIITIYATGNSDE
ncbi:MAG: histidine kinase, partial [Crocinitomicaceae bacterium]|nr:histidine kinase [Crocinitomicaceae bacterium]